MKRLLAVGLLFVLIGAWASAEGVVRGPIVIRSDADFTAANGVVAGTGSAEDPFVISGHVIDEIGADHAVFIQNTSRHFVVRDVSICGAKVAGIKVVNARNGRIEDVLVEGCVTGIMLHMVRDVTVSSTTVEDCSEGVRVLFSTAVHLQDLLVQRTRVGVWWSGVTGASLVGSTLSECDLGVQLELGCQQCLVAKNALLNCRIMARSHGRAQWDDGRCGNYWGDYSAPDEDGDGILDHAYAVGPDEDRFPLATRPE
ncbi:MAG: NosD domain-containing protein [Candidatus Bipolaricaulaceae bacterium]